MKIFKPCQKNLSTKTGSATYEPRGEKTGLRGFPIRSDTNRAVQSKKMARCLKFRIKEDNGLYYLCSENKGAGFLMTRLIYI